MDDSISRQDALDIGMKYCSDDDGSCSEPHTDLREMLDEIENLPSAQRKGHWIDKEICFTCSECAHDSIEGGNFCPNCGADMREPHD